MALRFRWNQPGVGRRVAAPMRRRRDRWLRRVMRAQPLGPEDAEQEDHDEHHRDRADHADRGGEALPPQAELERLVVHEDRPGVGRRVAVEAAEDQILVDHRHRRAEAQHDQDHHDRREPRPGHVPEDLPFVGAVDAGGFRQVLGDRREAGEEEDRVVAEAPPHFHDRDRGQASAAFRPAIAARSAAVNRPSVSTRKWFIGPTW